MTECGRTRFDVELVEWVAIDRSASGQESTRCSVAVIRIAALARTVLNVQQPFAQATTPPKTASN